MENENFELAEPAQATHVMIDSKDNQSNLSLTWENIQASAKVKKGVTKQILHPHSGIAMGGQLTAIMGSSGAGKSTLMNILARRNLGGIQVDGITRVNGQAYTSKISNISSYVQQNDIFVGTLTVREYITFIVRLR